MQLAVRLESYIDEGCHQVFDWKRSNCCLFVAGWIEAVTGHNPMGHLRETTSGLDARALLDELGGTLEAAWTLVLGHQPVAASFAQVGDIVLVPMPSDTGGLGELVGICTGRQIVCVAHSGLIRVDTEMGALAWRVGTAA